MTLGAPRFNETGSNIKDNLCNVVSQQRQKICSFYQVEKLNAMMEKLYPLDKLNDRRLLRDQKLASLAKLKKNFE